MPEPAADRRTSPRPSHLRAVPAGAARAATDPHPLLELAGAEVAEAWAPLLHETFEPAETRDVLSRIVASVHGSSRGGDCPPTEGPIALVRFLLERVSSALLRLLAADPTVDKSDVLALMHGVDVVRQAVEPEWDRYFASQISGPDGLSLVIEVAHDLRSPLTSIRCLAETIERGQSGPVTELQRKQLRLIYSASLGLGSMATDVIEMARRGDHLTEGEAVPFSVSEVLEGVAEMVRPIAEEKQLTFSYTGPVTDHRVGLPVALSRVLLNLATNALKFTETGGVELVGRATGMSRVEFSVLDTGRGIPEEAAANLFKPFRRSSSRSGRSGYLFSGTGLGLALCRKMLRAMSSDLRYETTQGVGTRFYFEIELPPTARL